MSAWPDLVYDEWVETLDTVHMIVQILGKVRVALSPKEPEWAHITLYVSARGLSTGAIPLPSGDGVFDVEADFLAHEVVLRSSTGESARVPLAARPVAQFWSEFGAGLHSIGVDVELSPMPQEVPDPIPFPDDDVHTAYDPEAAMRFGRALAAMEPVFAAYRADFAGKVSRVQFFWGSADLVVTRFSGVPCEAPPGTDMLTRLAHDVEQINVGWWPGNAAYPHAAFYAYAYPKPDGIEDAVLGVANAGWNAELGEFILDHDVVRAAPSPEAVLRAFLDAAYDACATRSHWDPRLTQ
jgi:hypothetical protein